MRAEEIERTVSQDFGERRENPETDDHQIVREVISGEVDRFRILVLRHQSLIFSLMLRQTGDRELAEELAQDAFLKAYRHLKLFRFESKFSTWLTRIALNSMNSYFSSRAYKERSKTESFSAEVHDRSDSASADSKSDVEQFRALIGTLSPKLRDVLVLCCLEGKSYEEAATVLCIPIGTVRSRLNKARLILKEAFLASAGGVK